MRRGRWSRALILLTIAFACLSLPSLVRAATVARSASPASVAAQLDAPHPALIGDRARVFGQVSGAATGTITVQRRTGRAKWVGQAIGHVVASGAFHVDFPLQRVGSHAFRVVYGRLLSTVMNLSVRDSGARVRVKPTTTVLRSGVVAVSGNPRKGQTIQLAAGVRVPSVGSVVVVP